MKKQLFLIWTLCLAVLPLLSQGEIDDQRHTLFKDESTFAGFLQSNGFGLNYRYGFYRDAKNQFIVDADFSYVKHPKEVKTLVAYDWQTRRYVYGKENLFWELKGAAGWQNELYRKHDKNGISVRLFYAGGISLGFLKPIYYEVYTFNPTTGIAESMELLKFEDVAHQSNIGGKGPFFKGFSELGLVPGAQGKIGMSFEYSQRNAIIHALEAGINLTIYPKRIPIMAVEDNNFLFFTLYVGYRFGNIVDISEAARAKSRKERRKERKEAATGDNYRLF